MILKLRARVIRAGLVTTPFGNHRENAQSSYPTSCMFSPLFVVNEQIGPGKHAVKAKMAAGDANVNVMKPPHCRPAAALCNNDGSTQDLCVRLKGNVMKTKAMAALFGLCAMTTPALADQQQVDVIGDTFFPPIVIVSPGDQIVFYNRAGTEGNIAATDGSWETGTLTQGASYTLDVTADMTTTYNFAGFSENSGVIAIAQ